MSILSAWTPVLSSTGSSVGSLADRGRDGRARGRDHDARAAPRQENRRHQLCPVLPAISRRRRTSSPRTVLIASFALCGFAGPFRARSRDPDRRTRRDRTRPQDRHRAARVPCDVRRRDRDLHDGLPSAGVLTASTRSRASTRPRPSCACVRRARASRSCSAADCGASRRVSTGARHSLRRGPALAGAAGGGARREPVARDGRPHGRRVYPTGRVHLYEGWVARRGPRARCARSLAWDCVSLCY